MAQPSNGVHSDPSRLGSDAQVPTFNSQLRFYYCSGWAFLIPYLLLYLVYVWQKWPANPTTDGQFPISGDRPRSTVHWLPIPPLLYVYWALHAIHIVLAARAFLSWWSDVKGHAVDRSLGAIRSLQSRGLPYTPLYLTAIRAVSPWLLLALIFAIPGVYLEWPADPWEHLRRITEWQTHPLVSGHSAGYKSFYFFAYSFIGRVDPMRLLPWLNVYYVGISLLLAWQYYLLAKEAGLSPPFAFVSVLLNVLTSGNVCFSLYRYYGISSSVYAQLGAIALTRIILTVATQKRPQSRFFRSTEPLRGRTGAPPRLLHAGLFVLSVLGLLTLIACNHHQGMGIAGLGVGAVLTWWIARKSRAGMWWLLTALVLSSGIFRYAYWRSSVIETFRTQGFLSAWYGFNLLSYDSSAARMALQVVGFFGIINLVAAILVLRRNHVIGWLTVTPPLALLLPIVALPLANAISDQGTIVTFARMLFAMPPCLALCWLMQASSGRQVRSNKWWGRAVNTIFPVSPEVHARGRQRIKSFALICIAITLAMIIPSSERYHNRIWHTLAKVPDDLQLRALSTNYEAAPHSQKPTIFVTPAAGTALLSLAPINLVGAAEHRQIGTSPVGSITEAMEFHHSRKALSRGSSDLLARTNYRSSVNWVTLGGSVAEVTGTSSDVVAQNPVGAQSFVFRSELLPIQRFGTYQVSMNVRTQSGAGGEAYLAVAWYDAEGKMLEANSTAPQGAANPRGWNNGTYSYFGLISDVPPPEWTKYTIAFGLGEHAAIPPHAHYIRLGALLNYNGAKGAILQLTGVRLSTKEQPEEILLMPAETGAYSSSTSQAAQLSRHWPPQQVMIDHGGTRELRRTEPHQ